MSWYAAHIVMYIRFQEPPQRDFRVWENIVLIEAPSRDAALEKAIRRGREDEGDSSGSLTWGGRPAEWVLGGVRKICECVDPDKTPGDGTEVSYLEFDLESLEQLERYVNSKSVCLSEFDTADEETAETSPVSSSAASDRDLSFQQESPARSESRLLIRR